MFELLAEAVPAVGVGRVVEFQGELDELGTGVEQGFRMHGCIVPPGHSSGLAPHPMTDTPLLDALLDERALSKLRWRCRRGLLENDLFIERFFARHESGLTVRQADALGLLMDLSDNDLLDLLLGRKPLQGDLEREDVTQVLALLRGLRPLSSSEEPA
mgnify:CR=1 FL=1